MSKQTWNGAKYGSKKKARAAEYREREEMRKWKAVETRRLEILLRKF